MRGHARHVVNRLKGRIVGDEAYRFRVRHGAVERLREAVVARKLDDAVVIDLRGPKVRVMLFSITRRHDHEARANGCG